MSLTLCSLFCTMVLLSKPVLAASALVTAHEVGDVTIFAGTSGAGKSSLAQALIKLEPTLLEEDLDLRHDPHLPCDPDMQQAMFDDVIEMALKGKKVLVHVDQGEKFLKRMKEKSAIFPVKSVLVFCSFPQLAVRNAARNQSLRKSDWRDPLMPFDQYSNLYTAKRNSGTGLETLALADLVATCNAQFDGMIAYAKKMGNTLPSEEQIKKDKAASLLEFLAKIGARDDDVSITMEPHNKDAYTVVVDNSSADGVDALAALIHKGAAK